MLIYYFWRWINIRRKIESTCGNREKQWIKGAGIIFFWTAGIIWNLLLSQGKVRCGVGLATVVVLFFLVTEDKMGRSAFFSHVGSVSYSLYLTHEFVVKGISRLVTPLETLSALNVIGSLACALLAILVATATNRWIERRCAAVILRTVHVDVSRQ